MGAKDQWPALFGRIERRIAGGDKLSIVVGTLRVPSLAGDPCLAERFSAINTALQ